MYDYLTYFFNPSHLWSLRPPLMQPRALWILGITFAAFCVAGLVLRGMANRSRDGLFIQGYRKLVHFFLTFGIVGFVYLFAAYEGAILLSSRFWLLIMAVSGIIWATFIARYFWKEVPRRRRELTQKREFAKYLP